MQRKRQEATKPQKPTTKEQQATNDTDNPDTTKNAKNAPPTTAPAGATLCFVSFGTCVTCVTGVAAARARASQPSAPPPAMLPVSPPAPPPAPTLRRRGERIDGEATAKRRRSDGEATAKRRRSDERSDGFRCQIDSKHSKRGQKSMRKKGRSRLALLAPPLRCCRAALLLLACPRRQPLPSRQPLRQARRRRLRALVALALAFVDALQSPSLIFDLSVLKTICDARRGTTSPLLSLPFGCWVLGGRRLVLGLLHLPLRPSEACPAPRAPTTSIAAHAGHQHSCSSCGRNVTFLSSAQMKKKSSRMMMNRIMHADEL